MAQARKARPQTTKPANTDLKKADAENKQDDNSEDEYTPDDLTKVLKEIEAKKEEIKSIQGQLESAENELDDLQIVARKIAQHFMGGLFSETKTKPAKTSQRKSRSPNLSSEEKAKIEELIKSFLKSNPESASSDIIGHVISRMDNVSDAQVRNKITYLKKEGVIKVEGKTRNGKWSIA